MANFLSRGKFKVVILDGDEGDVPLGAVQVDPFLLLEGGQADPAYVSRHGVVGFVADRATRVAARVTQAVPDRPPAFAR